MLPICCASLAGAVGLTMPRISLLRLGVVLKLSVSLRFRQSCGALKFLMFFFYHSTTVELSRHDTFHALLAVLAPNVTPVNYDFFVLPLYDRVHDTCVACGCGDNSIAHWTRFCIVPFVTWYFIGDNNSFSNIAQIAAAGHDHLVVASIVIHQFRRLLIERCGMHHNADGRTSVQWSTLNWINTLGQQSHQALPAHVVKRGWPSFLSSSSRERLRRVPFKKSPVVFVFQSSSSHHHHRHHLIIISSSSSHHHLTIIIIIFPLSLSCFSFLFQFSATQ